MNYRKELYKLFQSTIVAKDQTKELQAFIDRAEKIITDNLPTKLYRFRSCNINNISAFQSNKCFMSAPSQFNDPFDSLLPSDNSDLIELIHQTYDVVGMVKSIDETGELPSFHQKIWSKPFQETIKNYLRSIPSENYPKLIQKLKQQREYEISKTKAQTEPAIHFVQDHAYVSCFLEDIRSILMWSHYADYHKGFALEYDFKNNQNNIKLVDDIFPVMYSREPYNAKEIVSAYMLQELGFDAKISDCNYWLKAVLYKASEWSYEKEWRLLKNRDDSSSLFTSVDLFPSAIYYGCKIDDNCYSLLHNISRMLNIKEYKMQMSEDNKSYRMKYIKL